MGASGAGVIRGVRAVVMAAVFAGVVPACGLHLKTPLTAGFEPSIAPIARFVEHDRGLLFQHPVTVHLLSDAEFERQFSRSFANTGVFSPSRAGRALGLATKQVVRISTPLGFTDSPVGVYEPRTGQISIRSTLGAAYQAVVTAHELTHALQDQHALPSRGTLRSETSGQRMMSTLLVEGDARRVEVDYAKSRGETFMNQMLSDENHFKTIFDASHPTELVTPGALAYENAPYVIGQDMIRLAFAVGGNTAVDQLLERPPADYNQAAEPLAIQLGQDRHLDASTIHRQGAEWSGTLSRLSLLAILASRIDGHAALKLAEQAQSVPLVSYRDGQAECVEFHYTGKDNKLAATSLRAWAATLGNDATVSQAGSGTVTVHSCGTPAALPKARTPDKSATSADPLLVLLRARFGVTDSVAASDRRHLARAQCIGDKVSDLLTVDQAETFLKGWGKHGLAALPAGVLNRVRPTC